MAQKHASSLKALATRACSVTLVLSLAFPSGMAFASSERQSSPFTEDSTSRSAAEAAGGGVVATDEGGADAPELPQETRGTDEAPTADALPEGHGDVESGGLSVQDGQDALADDGAGRADDGAAEADVAAAAQARDASGVIDLNAAWADTSSSFTISESGTYRLSGDIAATRGGTLVVNGEGIEVVLQLDGHELSFNLDNGFTYGLCIANAASVSIDGGSERGGITYSNANMEAAVSMEAEGTLSISSARVLAAPSSANADLASLGVSALSVEAGAVTVEDSELSVDLSNQTRASFERDDEHPSAVRVENAAAVQGVTLRRSAVSAESSLMATVRAAAEETGPGMSAYGVESLAASRTVIDGCTVSACSPYGSAYAVSGRNVSFEGGATTVAANAGYRAVGAESRATSGILLDAPLKSDFSGQAVASVQAALFAESERAFEIGADFAGERLGVLVEKSAAEMNEAGMVAAVFPDGAASGAEGLAGAFSNALGADAPCDVSVGADGVSFALVESRAPAEVLADGGSVRYSSVGQALSAAHDGQTVRLLRDVGAVLFDKSGNARQTVTLDLNGHAVASLSHASRVGLSVASSTPGGVIEGRDAETNAAVAFSGSGSLTISGVAVRNVSASTAAYGIAVTGSGALALQDVNVEASSSAGETVALSVASPSSAKVTAERGSLSASTSQAGGAVDGVRNLSARASVSVADCPVTAEGMDGATGGVRTAGAFSASGSAAGSQAISATTQDTAAFAWGVRATAATADVALDDCSVSVSGAAGLDTSGGSYWTLMAGTAAAPVRATWRLSGACGLSSSNGTHILHSGVPIELGDDFSNAGGTMTVRSSGLDGDVFARSAGGASVSALSRAFTPQEGSAYGGWTVAVAEDESALRWQHDAVVKNQASGQAYPSLESALSAAQDGDVLRLVDDVDVTGQLTVARAVTLDLSGHELSVEAGSAASNGAVRATAAGTVSIVDEENGGRLSITVGGDPETGSANALSSYAGVVAAGGGLTVDGASVEVAYDGSSDVVREVALYGVRADAGAVSLRNGATLAVRACSPGAAFGASRAFGVYAADDGAEDVSVDASSSVTVESSAPAQRGGSVLNAQVDSEAALRNPVLERVFPDEDSALYAEILEKFRATAQLDDASASAESAVYGARVYYAAPLTLDDGTYVWAFSDYVPAGEETLDHIVPAVMYVQTNYTIEPSAVGVAASDDAECDVALNGRVTVRAASGEATAVDARGSGAWAVSRASLSATAATGHFVRKVDEPLDLKDVIESPAAPQRTAWMYPEGQTICTVEEGVPRAVGIAAADGTTVTVDASTTVRVQGGDPVNVEGATVGAPRAVTAFSTVGSSAEEWGSPFALSYYPLTALADRTVGVTFSNLRAADGSSRADVAGTVRYGGTLGSLQGASIPSQGDYSHNGVTYRFVGWRNASSTDGTWDAADAPASLVFDGTLAGVSGGAVTLVAQYVRVDEGQSLVTFKSGAQLVACAVDDGDRPTYADATGNAAVAPSMPGGDESLVYTFAGWHEGRLAAPVADDESGAGVGGTAEGEEESADSAEDGAQLAGDEPSTTPDDSALDASSVDYAAGTALPPASQDTVYTACFSASSQNSYVSFAYWMPGEDGYVYGQTDAIRVDFGTDPIDVANGLAKPGDVVVAGGKVYSFLGWSPRPSDKEALYTTSLPAATVTAARASDNRFYGVYAQEDQLVTVSFHSGDAVYAVAVDRTANSTVGSAFSSTGMASPENGVEGEVFQGWSTSPDGASVNALSSASLLSLAGTGGTLDLYAVFGNEKALSPGQPSSSTPVEGGGQDAPAPGEGGSNGSPSDATSGGTLPSAGSGGPLATSDGGTLSASGLSGGGLARSNAAAESDDAAAGSAEAASSDPLSFKREAADDSREQQRSDAGSAASQDASAYAPGSISGDPAVWTAVVLALAAFTAGAWWLLIGRYRGRKEDEDGGR